MIGACYSGRPSCTTRRSHGWPGAPQDEHRLRVPGDEGDPYYPIPRPENADLYRRYRELAEETQGVWLVGRLATYRDYNMDRVVAQALTTYKQITGAKAVCPNARQPELVGA